MPSLLILSLQFKLDSNLVRKMKSTTCLHLKSPVRKRGVERAKLKFKNYFWIGNSTWIQPKNENIIEVKHWEGYFQEIPVRDQFL